MVAPEPALRGGRALGVERARPPAVSPLLLDGREARQAERVLQAVRAELAREDGQRPSVEPRRLVEAAARLDDRRQRGDVGRDGRVVGAERRLPQHDGPPRVGLGLGVAPARVLDAAQVVVQRRARPPIAAARAAAAARW